MPNHSPALEGQKIGVSLAVPHPLLTQGPGTWRVLSSPSSLLVHLPVLPNSRKQDISAPASYKPLSVLPGRVVNVTFPSLLPHYVLAWDRSSQEQCQVFYGSSKEDKMKGSPHRAPFQGQGSPVHLFHCFPLSSQGA